MQVAPSVTELRAAIEAAFGAAEVPPAETVLAELYREDPPPAAVRYAFESIGYTDEELSTL